MNVTKKDFAKKISIETETSSEISTNFVNTFFEMQKKLLKSGNLKISKFGSYNITLSPERIGRNPKTLKEYPIPEKKRVSFKVSKRVKKALN